MWDRLLDCWWGQILVGLFFFVIGAFLYWYISGRVHSQKVVGMPDRE